MMKLAANQTFYMKMLTAITVLAHILINIAIPLLAVKFAHGFRLA